MPSIQEQGESLDHNIMPEANIPNDKSQITLKNVKKGRLITQGNIGEIFEVIDESTNIHYIGKSLYVHYQDYPKKLRINIKRHINQIKQLNFPSILKLYDFNEKGYDNENRQTVLLEYFPHGSLEDVLSSQLTVLDNTRKFILIYGIALGLQYLHSHDILHHDIKLSSIIIDDDFFPKINNIGFTNLFYSLKSMAKVKEFSPYTAPEYITDNEYSKPSEVYAFGMIVYQILTNKKPFEKVPSFEMLQKIMEHHLPYLDDSIPQAYRNLIEKCWSANPKERYTFEEICKELKNNDEFLQNVERIDDVIKYIKLVDDFIDENQPFDQIFDNLIIENEVKNQKKSKKTKKGRKKMQTKSTNK